MNIPHIGLFEDDDENKNNNNKNHFSGNALNNFGDGCDRRGLGGKIQKLKKQVQDSILKLFTK